MGAVPTNLERSQDELVGRQRELDELTGRLLDGERLCSIVGTCGVGKSRLAIEVGRQVATRSLHPGGVWMVDLGACTDETGVSGAVARALQLSVAPPRAGGDLATVVGAALAGRGALVLLLDGFEHVISAARGTIERWSGLAPRVQFLVTSREPLELGGERVIALDLLEVPPANETDPASIAEYSAVALFVARAQAVRPTYVLTEGDAEHVAMLVRALDGLPLAIELCAARMAVLNAAQLLEQIEQRFELLRRAEESGPVRHRTLQGAIDWSWNLLTPVDREALARCSVFRGGWDLEAATAVLGTGEHSAIWTADRLQSLKTRSLLTVLEPDGPAGPKRYALLDSIRTYAAEQLERLGQTEDTRELHGRHFVERGARWSAEVDGHDGASALVRLCRETPNLMRAFEHAMAGRSKDRRARAVRVCLALAPLFDRRGPQRTHRAMIDAALKGAHDLDAGLAARGWLSRGASARLDGLGDAALESVRRSLALARRARERELEIQAHIELARIHLWFGEPAAARPELEQAGRLLAQSGPVHLRASLQRYLGHYHWLMGEPEAAIVHLRSAIRDFEALGDRRGEAAATTLLGNALFARKELQESVRAWAWSADLFDRDGDPRSAAGSRGNVALALQEEGDFEQARQLLLEALSVHREVGDRGLEGIRLGCLGDLELETGHCDEAVVLYTSALSILRDVGDHLAVGLCHARLGAAHALADRLVAAQASFDESDAALAGLGGTQEATAARIHRGHLGLAQARAAARQGKSGNAVARLAPRPRGAVVGANADVRLARRLLDRGTEALHQACDARRLRIGPEARWFDVDGCARVPLESRHIARRLLQALADAHAQEPGRTLTLEDLFRAGWPGEQARWTSVTSRVHVSVMRLRRMGLGPLLLHREGGYLLDPGATVLAA